jgi:hypothetical protein
LFKSQLTAQLSLQKPTPDILVSECSNVHWWLTGTMVHPSQGVRQHTDGCTALWYSKAAKALLCRKLITGGDRNELCRLTCLAITRVMKMTQRVAMEVLLGHPTLHMIIEAEGQSSIYRLVCSQQ